MNGCLEAIYLAVGHTKAPKQNPIILIQFNPHCRGKKSEFSFHIYTHKYLNKLPEPDIKVPGISNLMGVLLHKRTAPRNTHTQTKRTRAVEKEWEMNGSHSYRVSIWLMSRLQRKIKNKCIGSWVIIMFFNGVNLDVDIFDFLGAHSENSVVCNVYSFACVSLHRKHIHKSVYCVSVFGQQFPNAVALRIRFKPSYC